MKFCEKLKTLRMDKGFTQEELAKRLFVSRSAVAKWEQGRGYPSLEMLEKLSGLLNFSIDELLDEKEYRKVTLDNSVRVAKHNRYGKLIALISAVIVVIFALMIALFYMVSGKQGVEYVNGYAYCRVEIKETGIYMVCDNDFYATYCVEKGDEFFIENESNLLIYDKFGKETKLDSLRTGYIVKLNFCSESYNKVVNPKIQELHIIEDYVDGDYNVCGFFLSPEELDGTKSYEEIVKDTGKYPYVKVMDGAYVNGGFVISREKEEAIAYSQVHENYIIKERGDYALTLSSDKTYYLYVIDNSERGYTFERVLKSQDMDRTYIESHQIEGGLLPSPYILDKNITYPTRIEYTFAIRIEYYKSVSTIKIYEYDKNGACIYTQEYQYDDFNRIKDIYITQDETRYVQVVTYDSNGTRMQANRVGRGNQVTVQLQNEKGYVIYRTIYFY